MAKLLSYYQGNDNRKVTGGYRARPYKVKRKALGGGPPVMTALAKDNEYRVKERVTGGNVKVRLYKAVYANVYDKSTGTSKKVKIIRVLETPSNPEFAKRGIIVKGAIIETELGRAVVTSRPSQDGIVNAVKLS